jgi:hypothetical protein
LLTTISALIAITACVLQIAGHIKYNKQSGIEPNVASWTIWGITSIIDTWNYSVMTGDWQKNILSITCSLCCLITWVICLFRHRLSKFKLEHVLSLVICALAMVIWHKYGDVKDSNMILQLDNFVSFTPIIWAVWRRPSDEHPAAWMLWTASYTLGIIVVLMRYQQWQDLMYPVSCAILHFIVGSLSKRRVAIGKPSFSNTI